MKKMKDYHDLYLKCDVLLVDDVFEKFRNSSLKNHRLCSSQVGMQCLKKVVLMLTYICSLFSYI